MNIAAILYRTLLFIATTACCSEKITAQIPAAYSYEYFNSSHGLPSSETISLAKDSKGFLWIGTPSGLSRYDGYQFYNYSLTRDNELIGYVNVLAPDAQNRLWIGSDAGLFCCVNNEIVKISATASSPQGVNDILPEKDGTLWLATENGPARIHINNIDITGAKKISLSDFILPQWPFKNSEPSVRKAILIEKATDGTLYIAQHYSLFRLNEDKTELLHHVLNDRDQILTIIPVSKSKVFFNSVETEIHKIENGVHTNIQHKALYQPGVNDNLEGTWYQGTFGLYYFHPETAVVSRFINTLYNGISWPTAMLQDDNFFWVASHDGLVKIKPSLFHHYTTGTVLPHHTDFYSILQLKKGNLLLGSNRGNLLQKKDSGFSLLWKNIVPSAEIKALYEDERGWLWIGSGYQGIVLVKNNKPQIFTVENGLHDYSYSRFLKTTSGRLYAIGDQGVSEIIVAPDNTISFKKYFFRPSITKNGKFYASIEGPDGSIWIGGEEGICHLLNDSLQRVSIYNKQLSVKDMLKDKEGNIWIATDGEGILKCVFNGSNVLEAVKQFTEEDGLTTLHYLALVADKDNNIWAGSTIGLTCIGQQGRFKGRILNFDEQDGFIKPGYYSMCLYLDRTGIIWAGTSLGFVSFKPDELFLSDAFPQVYITGVHQREKHGTISDLPSGNKFPYRNNSFNFGFVALDYASQKGVRYFYKLDGLDTNWISAGGLRSVSFENLSPGKYTFHVKAINNKGRWSRQDAVYSFSIAAPFWKTWWFVSLLLLTIAALTAYLIKRRIQFIQKREAEKTELQKVKTASYQARLEAEQVINYFATSISAQTTVDEMLWDVAKNLIGKLGFEDCMIYLWNKDKTVLLQRAGFGTKGSMQSEMDKNIYHVPKGKGIVGAAVETMHYIMANDTSSDKRYFAADEKIRLSELCVPIVHGNEAMGAINTEHSEKNFYTDRHLHILSTIASMLADKIDMIEAQQLTREKEMEVLQLNKDFATSQLTALRMQMNPHFIFNALNSIQHYILQGNVIEANKYLSKFSKLQREILHCSSQQFISLEKELEILAAYLELEQHRFGKSFTYKINVHDAIEPVEINIPPMILQPFVENAIWHGLMPLQSERMLSIYFELETDDVLIVTLRDNGIGRTASAKLKENSGENKTEHQSKGMSMVQQRLRLLQQQYDRPFEVSIADITGIKGEVQGTEVTLRIFIGEKKYNYNEGTNNR